MFTFKFGSSVREFLIKVKSALGDPAISRILILLSSMFIKKLLLLLRTDASPSRAFTFNWIFFSPLSTDVYSNETELTPLLSRIIFFCETRFDPSKRLVEILLPANPLLVMVAFIVVGV
mgnify:CR=1 FL=1